MKFHKILMLLVFILALSSCNSINNNTGIDDLPANHNHDYKTKIYEPSCEEQGYTFYYCECGDNYTGDYVNASHNLEHIKGVTATCSNPGIVEHWHCLNCDKYFYDENCENQVSDAEDLISTSPHCYMPNINEVFIEYPSESSPGYLYSFCDFCGEEKKIYYHFSNDPDVFGVAYLEYAETVEIIGLGLFEGDELIVPNEINGKRVTEIKDYQHSVVHDEENISTPYLSPFIESDLSKIIIGDNVEILNVAFPETLDKIIFSDKENLKELKVSLFSENINKFVVPNGVECLELLLFTKGVLDLTLPKTIKRIARGGIGLANGQDLVINFKYNGTIKDYCDIYIDGFEILDIDGCELFNCYFTSVNLYLLDEQTSVYYPVDTLIIPSDVEIVPSYRFKYFNFENIIIKEGVEKIGKEAFHSTNIKNILLPNSVIYIGHDSIDTDIDADIDAIYYLGSKTQFEEIYIEHHVNELTNYVYYYSENKPAEDGCYWHYDLNGKPVIWK